MRTKIIICLLVLFPFSAFADVVGVRLGGGLWDWGVSGQLRYDPNGNNTNTTEADVKNDLHLADDSTGFGYVSIEHPVPILPNIRVVATSLSTRGSGVTTVSFTYGNTTYSINDTLTTELVLDQTDITLYWEILDNVVGLDIGLNAKNIDGRASITTSSGVEKSDISVTIPMLYAAVDFSLPYGFSLGGNAATISYDGSSVSDYMGYLRYTSDYVFGVEVGYRNQTYKFNDLDDYYGEIKFDGPYAGLFLYF